ncbi:MAG: hypothetical protein PHI40_06545 [Caldisericia bacterium]|nr:hypothetical protein [Caldisericia bacterium]
MKKTITKILTTILIFSLFIPFTVQAGGVQSQYAYVMQIGSKDMTIQKDQKEPKTVSLLYPIVLDKESGRSGIAIEIFEGWGGVSIPTIRVVSHDTYADTRQDLYTLSHTNVPKSGIITEFKLLFPDGIAWIEKSKEDDYSNIIEEAEIPVPFIPYMVDIEESPGRVVIAPFRIIFENLHHKVDWNPDTQEITVTYPAPETEE